jgi:hypothetical protein
MPEMTIPLRRRSLCRAAVRKSLAAMVMVVACTPAMLAVTRTNRPAYCHLPENITFDRTQHPEMIGFYTGTWTPTGPILYVRKFCLLLTSIRGNEVRGIYSWEAGDWDGPSGWRELDTDGPGSLSTIRFQAWNGAHELTLSVEFHKKEATATYTKTGKNFLGLPIQTVLQSRLVKIE